MIRSVIAHRDEAIGRRGDDLDDHRPTKGLDRPALVAHHDPTFASIADIPA